jgi:lantibiotic modifying enzyme
VQAEIEIAMDATTAYGVREVDSLCCGNFGRIEALLEGSRALGRPEWRHTALSNATISVLRARQMGAYRLFRNLPTRVSSPGFFVGTSGVGYQLLRLLKPALPSVLLWE